VTRPFEPEILDARPPFATVSATEVAGLLHRAADGLAWLEQMPCFPGTNEHLSAAAHAVHRALIELESID